MNITITGTTGFVGGNLSNFLKEEKKSEVVRLSLRNPWVLDQNSDAIIHLAGKAHDTKKTSDESEYYKINTELTQKLFDDFLKSEIHDFIFFSSVKSAADSIDGVLDENYQPNPQTAYGKSKHLAEAYLLSKTIPENKRLFIVRPCMIHGPGNKGNLNLLHKLVEKGIPWPLAAFDNQRSFLGINNLNFLIFEILNHKKIASGIYNFADDASVSTNDLISLMAHVNGKKARLWRINPHVISKIAKLGDAINLPLNSERLKKLTESYVVSNQKIKNALNLDKLPHSTFEGLKQTLDSF